VEYLDALAVFLEFELLKIQYQMTIDFSLQRVNCLFAAWIQKAHQ